MASRLALYGDTMSQPVRSVLLLLKCTNTPFDFKRTLIPKLEHKTPEFLKINPLGTLPALTDGDVSIGDSFAIMSYVCTTRSVPDHWYPRDPAQRAAVDAVVGWHGSMLRASSMITVFNRVLAFQTGMEPAAEAVVDFHVHRLKQSLKVIDGTFLRAGRDWVAGGADISIADLLLACEIDMLTLLDASKAPPTLGSLLERNPRVAAWMQRVERRCDPHWTEARAMLVRARAAFVAKAKM